MPNSAYTANLPADIIKDSGVLYINGTTPFGASNGGLSFDPGVDRRNVDFDSKRSDVMGLDRTIGFAPKISGSLKKFGTADVAVFEPASTSAVNAGVTTITPKKAGVLLVSGDYLTNVRLVFERGSGGYVWVKFPKALCTKYDVKGKDKDEADVSIEIQARLDLSGALTTDDAPYVIEYAAAI